MSGQADVCSFPELVTISQYNYYYCSITVIVLTEIFSLTRWNKPQIYLFGIASWTSLVRTANTFQCSKLYITMEASLQGLVLRTPWKMPTKSLSCLLPEMLPPLQRAIASPPLNFKACCSCNHASGCFCTPIINGPRGLKAKGGAQG